MLDADISTRDALANLTGIEVDEHAIDRRRFLQLVGMGAGAGIAAGRGDLFASLRQGGGFGLDG